MRCQSTEHQLVGSKKASEVAYSRQCAHQNRATAIEAATIEELPDMLNVAKTNLIRKDAEK